MYLPSHKNYILSERKYYTGPVKNLKTYDTDVKYKKKNIINGYRQYVSNKNITTVLRDMV